MRNYIPRIARRSSAGKTSNSSATVNSRSGSTSSSVARTSIPDGVLIASIMEEFDKNAWIEIVERCEAAGVDAFELNFLLPARFARTQDGRGHGPEPRDFGRSLRLGHGQPRRKPVWAKMTPNVTRIEDPSRAALRAGCQGFERDQHHPQRHERQPRHATPRANRRGLHNARVDIRARQCGRLRCA